MLWAYRVTWKITTSFSPYEVVYGKKPMLPIELEIKTRRITQLSMDLDESQKEILLQLNAFDEASSVPRQWKKWHDNFIKEKQFQEAMLFFTIPNVRSFQESFKQDGYVDMLLQCLLIELSGWRWLMILILYASLKVITLLVLSDRYVVLQSLEVFHSCFTSVLQSVIHSIDIFYN